MAERQMKAYIENISDDFQSTFAATGPDTFQNMMGHKSIEDDKKELHEIVNKYIPNSKLTFKKLGWTDPSTVGEGKMVGKDYDCYIMIREDDDGEVQERETRGVCETDKGASV